MKKLIKEIEKFLKEECISQISSITYPVIKKLDFVNTKKQFKNLEKGTGDYYEYQDLLRHEKAWNTWLKLKKKLNTTNRKNEN